MEPNSLLERVYDGSAELKASVGDFAFKKWKNPGAGT